MQNKLMTSSQAICVLILFTLGSSLVVGVNTQSRQDSWIALLLGLTMFVPMLLVYARIVNLYPGQGIYDVITDVFGKRIGKAIILLYVLYAVHLGALVMRTFSEFLQIVAIPETPQLVTLLFLFFICIWMMKSGAGVLGRWSKIIIIPIFIAILVTLLLSSKFANINNLKPIGTTDFGTLVDSSFSVFAFPFGESILFSALFGHVDPTGNRLKIYIMGIAISSLTMLAAVLRNILVLGAPTMSIDYFPSYSAISIIALGDFLTRIEVLIGIVFMFGGFVKICVCMFAATIGISKLINVPDDRKLAVPVGLLMITLAMIIYTNTSQMFDWIRIYKYYALPFQVILPLIILVGAEIKTRLRKLAAGQP